MVAGGVRIEAQGDLRGVALECRRDNPARRDDEVRRTCRRQRLPVDCVREGAPELDVRGRRSSVIEADVRGPRRRSERRVVVHAPRHQVGEARRVSHHDHLRPAALVAGQRVCDRRAQEANRVGVAWPRTSVVGSSLEDELVVGSACDCKGAAHDLVLRLRPVAAVPLDRMPGLRSGVGAVHHAHEIGSRRRQPELDRPVVERPHADPVGVVVVPEVVVLAVLEHEVDRHGRAWARRIEHALDSVLHVARLQRRAVRPGEALAQVEDIAKTVV